MQPITSTKEEIVRVNDPVDQLVNLLLGISTASEIDAEKITNASRACLTSVLNILPAVDFIETAFPLIASSDANVYRSYLRSSGS